MQPGTNVYLVGKTSTRQYSARMHNDSDWNYVSRADQNRVPNLSRARFDYKRKDEDDMAKATKTYEERIRALEKKAVSYTHLPAKNQAEQRCIL